MKNRKLNRRDFLRFSAVTANSAALGACAVDQETRRSQLEAIWSTNQAGVPLYLFNVMHSNGSRVSASYSSLRFATVQKI